MQVPLNRLSPCYLYIYVCIYTCRNITEKEAMNLKGSGEHMMEGEGMEALEGWKKKPILVCEMLITCLFGFLLFFSNFCKVM